MTEETHISSVRKVSINATNFEFLTYKLRAIKAILRRIIAHVFVPAAIRGNPLDPVLSQAAKLAESIRPFFEELCPILDNAGPITSGF